MHVKDQGFTGRGASSRFEVTAEGAGTLAGAAMEDGEGGEGAPGDGGLQGNNKAF